MFVGRTQYQPEYQQHNAWHGDSVRGGVKASCIIVIYAFFIMYTFCCCAVCFLYFSCCHSVFNIVFSCHIDFVVCFDEKVFIYKALWVFYPKCTIFYYMFSSFYVLTVHLCVYHCTTLK